MLPQGPYLDRSQSSRRHFRRHADGIVQISSFDQVETTQLLLRLNKGTIRDRNSPVAHPQRRRRLHRLQRRRRDVMPAQTQLLAIGQHLLNDRGVVPLGESVERRFFGVDQAQVLHRLLRLREWPFHHLVVQMQLESTNATKELLRRLLDLGSGINTPRMYDRKSPAAVRRREEGLMESSTWLAHPSSQAGHPRMS